MSSAHAGNQDADPRPNTVGSATVRAPGVCGVLVQGVLGDMPFSVSCPVDFFSRVRVDLNADGPGVTATDGCEKTIAAVRRTLSHLRQAKVRAEVRVSSPIPRARGMGSSSADLSAAIAATALALGKELSPYDIAQIALSIEPSGGVMMPGLSLFDHRAGMVRETIGPPPPMEIVALDFGDSPRSSLDGSSHQWRWVDESTGEALALIRRGVAEKSPALVGRGATVAAEAAVSIDPRPRLDEVCRVRPGGRRRGCQWRPEQGRYRHTARRHGTPGQVHLPQGQGRIPRRGNGLSLPNAGRWRTHRRLLPRLTRTNRTARRWRNTTLQ